MPRCSRSRKRGRDRAAVALCDRGDTRLLGRRHFLRAGTTPLFGVLPLLAPWGCAARDVPRPHQPEPAPWAPLVASLEQRLPVWMAEARVPGLAFALIRNGRLCWQRGFGVADAGSTRAVDHQTIFEAASMSKPIFAYAVLQLHERRTLRLDTPLLTYGADSAFAGDPRLERVTARHVLSHTSGLPTWRTSSEPLALQFEPGARWLYSGEGYYWLQSVVTRLTGSIDERTCATYEADLEVCASDIDHHLRRRVLQPMGMSSSGYVWSAAIDADAARPHDAQGAPMPKSRPAATDAARYAAAGGLHCTVGDYARFLADVVMPGDGGDHRLAASTLDEMVRPVVAVSESPVRSSWALGWQVLHLPDGDLIAHGGDNRGFHSYAAASRARRSGFVVMTNGDGATRLWSTVLAPEMLVRLTS